MAFKRNKITVVSHISTTGPADALVEYLKNRAGRIIYIGHPFPYAKKTNSFYKIYEKAVCAKEHQFFISRLPGIFNYIKDFILTLFWMLHFEEQDLYIGIDNLNATAGVILKKIGKVRKVVFYTIDYVPKRFKCLLLNSLYHAFDRFAVRYSDLVWNLSDKMIYAREERCVSTKFRDKQIRVPIGTELDFKRLDSSNISSYGIAFMGHLRKGQGVELLLDSFADVLNRVPEARLHIFGTAPLEKKLKRKVINLGIKASVNFHGRIEDHGILLSELSKCTIAVAPYEDTDESYTRYTDPGKPKAYFSAGLPVIITKVPEINEEIERENCGKAVDYNRQEIANAIIEILKDPHKLKIMRENVKRVARKYEWGKIFNEAFIKL